jgi:hypothetical protein
MEHLGTPDEGDWTRGAWVDIDAVTRDARSIDNRASLYFVNVFKVLAGVFEGAYEEVADIWGSTDPGSLGMLAAWHASPCYHFYGGLAFSRAAGTAAPALRAAYLVGADGGRSVIRTAAGIDFVGSEATRSSLIAEVEVTEETPKGPRRDASGISGLHVLEDGRTVRAVVAEQALGPATDPTLTDLSKARPLVFGTDFGVHSPNYISSFTDATRQAATYRKGRVLLAGDAAHIHPPLGGKGLNLGVQDAFNLGWKLAQVVKGIAPDSLLDTYHAERHPVAARALKETMAHVAVSRLDDRSKALSDFVGDWVKTDDVRRKLGAELSGLGIRYDLGAGHPLLGVRMPDELKQVIEEMK